MAKQQYPRHWTDVDIQRFNTSQSMVCKTCEKVLPLAAFNKSSSNVVGRHYTCGACQTWLSRERGYYERKKAPMKDKTLQARFGITLQTYTAMLLAQGSRCAICRATEPSAVGKGKHAYFSVDHDHETGKVRGLLCIRCNTSLGMWRDSAELLEVAAAYLRQAQ